MFESARDVQRIAIYIMDVMTLHRVLCFYSFLACGYWTRSIPILLTEHKLTAFFPLFLFLKMKIRRIFARYSVEMSNQCWNFDVHSKFDIFVGQIANMLACDRH